MKATQAMYWIIGRDNPRQPPALAVETYDDNGAPIALRELATFKDPFVDACELAATQGVPADKVAHDEDSTDFFAQVSAPAPPRQRRVAGGGSLASTWAAKIFASKRSRPTNR